MKVVTDQLGRNISFKEYPQRIISLVPSQTELLFDLGLHHRVVGITRFCIHPNEWFRSKTRIGGTKTVKIEVIDSLQPDLILANKEENVREQIEALSEKYPVWISDINTLEDALSMIKGIGEVTGSIQSATSIANKIKDSFASIKALQTAVPTAYFIWRDPYMSVGHDTFIHDILQRSGMENVFEEFGRYPEVSIDRLRNAKPKLILLSSEPYPFKEKHISELQEQIPEAKILLVDGEMFSWYGSRLLKTPAYLNELISRIDGLI